MIYILSQVTSLTIDKMPYVFNLTQKKKQQHKNQNISLKKIHHKQAFVSHPKYCLDPICSYQVYMN